ncbi:MAG: MBL fold metallo-hydrolase [Gammaproteobacteria bacterium]|nr:MBL fold metallo-hydrolase [Gammaproteobacteria bacterium]
MRYISLGSGSRGNATLIEAGGTRVLLDCGFALRELELRLSGLGLSAADLDAVLVTHEHSDHIRGVGALARRYGLPVWLSPGTLRDQRFGRMPDTRIFRSNQAQFFIGGIKVVPYPVPHDAREPAQFIFESAHARLGVLTDVGVITPHIVDMLRCCSALVLECNHDREMLRTGPYPLSLQRRVGGTLGHLSNCQAAGLLERVDRSNLKSLLIAHVSEQNNRPQLALERLLAVAPEMERRLALTAQDSPSDWLEA